MLEKLGTDRRTALFYFIDHTGIAGGCFLTGISNLCIQEAVKRRGQVGEIRVREGPVKFKALKNIGCLKELGAGRRTTLLLFFFHDDCWRLGQGTGMAGTDDRM